MDLRSVFWVCLSENVESKVTVVNRKTKTTNLNLVQGKRVDTLRPVTCYFDKDWNAFVEQKDGSMQWISEHIVGIGEDFQSG
jgi:hypothetical protein